MAVIGKGHETFQLKGLRTDLADMVPKLTAAQFAHLLQFHRYDEHFYAWQNATLHDAHIVAWWVNARKQSDAA